MANFRNLIVSILLTGLFFVAIISFGAQLASNNNANSSILDSPVINSTYGNISSDLSSSDSQVQTQKNATEIDPGQTGDTLSIPSIWTSILSIGGLVTGLFNAMFGLLFVIGISPIVLAVFGAIVGISIIFWGWSMIRRGT